MSTQAVSSPAEKDPVCGMSVNPDTAKYAYEHAGTTHYFCHARCLEKFKANPEKYLGQPATQHSGMVMLDVAAGSQVPLSTGLLMHTQHSPKPLSSQAPAYVCPMCPEIREAKPGACPSCGMALESEMPTATRTEYTCPMHPEIVLSEPGSCPICGMALEPRTVTAAVEENPELRIMTRRFGSEPP